MPLFQRQRGDSRRGKPTRWDKAVFALKALYDQLDDVSAPPLRAALYLRIAKAEEAAASAVDLDVLPPLEPHEGESYAQVYADSARLARILSAGERAFGRYRPGSVQLLSVPRAQRGLWERYLASTNRAERAELLIHLSTVTEDACGYGAAAVLDRACVSEREIARRGGR